MTDQSLPGRQYQRPLDVRARPRPRQVPPGSKGKQWGRLDGTLAVACLEGNRVIFMKFDRAGRLQVDQARPARLRQFGRLRSVSVAPNGDLLVTTTTAADDADPPGLAPLAASA